MYGPYENWSSATEAARRIFDPFSYRVTLQARMVPICLAEAPLLAGRCPLVWCRNGAGDQELVALRALPLGAEVPGIRAETRRQLPLLLQAYPFRLRHNAPPFDIGLDAAAPLQERDKGSYILAPDGALMPGAEMKLNALEAYCADHAGLASLTRLVFGQDQVEPLRLPPELVAAHALPDMHVVRAFPDDARIFAGLHEADWPLLAQFLVAQRLSLHAMVRLIACSAVVAR